LLSGGRAQTLAEITAILHTDPAEIAYHVAILKRAGVLEARLKHPHHSSQP
jgi:hypothetical protein